MLRKCKFCKFFAKYSIKGNYYCGKHIGKGIDEQRAKRVMVDK
jgi:hypothetical protein